MRYVDSTLADCVNCLQHATSNNTTQCSMSATATLYYDSCLLSYSSNNFLSVADSNIPDVCLSNTDQRLDANRTKPLIQVLANLSASVPYTPGMFSKEVVTGTNITALMQCTRDLSPPECRKCISYAMSTPFFWCSIYGTALRMKMMKRNCYIRYDSYVFNVTAFPKSLLPSPPPTHAMSPSGGTVLGPNWVSISLQVYGVVAVVLYKGHLSWGKIV